MKLLKKITDGLQPAVKKETKKVAAGTFAGVVLMWAVFLILHIVMPAKIPFDYRVVLAGFFGGAVGVANFLWMGLTVQKVVATEDEGMARSRLRASYSQRMMMQGLWCVAAIALPCFQFVAGLVPLLFPSAVIKLAGVFGKK